MGAIVTTMKQTAIAPFHYKYAPCPKIPFLGQGA
jgi:hypothetical protein